MIAHETIFRWFGKCPWIKDVYEELRDQCSCLGLDKPYIDAFIVNKYSYDPHYEYELIIRFSPHDYKLCNVHALRMYIDGFNRGISKKYYALGWNQDESAVNQ